MITIYHNNRCSKSRSGLTILNDSGKKFEIREYLKEPPTPEELEELIKKLKLPVAEIIRKNEAVYKEKYKELELSDREWVLAICENPKLLQRPIVVHDDKAVIGRPPENIRSIL